MAMLFGKRLWRLLMRPSRNTEYEMPTSPCSSRKASSTKKQNTRKDLNLKWLGLRKKVMAESDMLYGPQVRRSLLTFLDNGYAAGETYLLRSTNGAVFVDGKPKTVNFSFAVGNSSGKKDTAFIPVKMNATKTPSSS